MCARILALLTLHTMRMRRIILSFEACLGLPYFPHIISLLREIRKRKAKLDWSHFA